MKKRLIQALSSNPELLCIETSAISVRRQYSWTLPTCFELATAQQALKALAAGARTHIGEGENCQSLTSDLHMQTTAHTRTISFF